MYMFQKEVRHSKRYQEIVNVFIKNGLSHLLFRIGITDRKMKAPKDASEDINNNLVNLGHKLRLALQELGPTFIKLGQIASTRRDVVPEEIGRELEKLQDDVHGFSFEEVEEIFKEEFNQTIDELFKNFTKEPLATASIGQVHIAHLHNGKEVAIKIQRPNIKNTMETDLDILFHLARLIENRTKWGKRYRILDVIEDFSDSLRNELDYLLEGRNGHKMRQIFAEDSKIRVPKIYWDYTTRKILTMEMVHGIKVNQVEQLKAEGYDLPLIADRIAHSLFTKPGNVITYLDFGLVGRLSDQMKYHFASLMIAVKNNSPDEMLETFEDMDLLDDVEDMTNLRHDLERLLGKYYEASLSEISLG